MKSFLVNFVLLVCFSGSSSIFLSEASLLSLPLSVSASEIDILLGSLTCLEDSTPFLLFFFFFWDVVPISLALWESCSILFGCPSGYRGSWVVTPLLVLISYACFSLEALTSKS